MGFKFRKSVNVAPGVKLNINKKSAGISVGTKGAHYTVNSKGKRTSTVGVPGTGVSYSTSKGGKSKSSGGSSLGCAGLLILFIPFVFIMAGLQYLREHPAVGIPVAVVFILAVIIAIVLFIRKKKANKYTEENLSSPSFEENDNNHSAISSHPTISTVDSTEIHKIHARLVNCYSEERQKILRRIYRNKNSEDFHIELSFETIVENNEDFIKVLVNDEIVGFVDKENTPKLIPVLNKMSDCFFDVKSRSDEGEKYHEATIHMTFKQ